MNNTKAITKLMRSGIPLLNRLESCLHLRVIPSATRGEYIVSTHTFTYYEDNGEYVESCDLLFYAKTVRQMRGELKKVYGWEEKDE